MIMGIKFRRFVSNISITTLTNSHYHFHSTCIIREINNLKLGRGNFFHYLNLPKSPALETAVVQRAYHNLQRRVHPDQANIQAKENNNNNNNEEVNKENPVVSSELSNSTSKLSEDKSEKSSFSSSLNKNLNSADAGESAYANASYEILRDPFLRCKYLSRLIRAEAMKGAPLTLIEEEQLMCEDDHRSLLERQKGNRENSNNSDMTLPQEFLAEMMIVNENIFTADINEEKDRAQLKLIIAHMEERYEECYSNAKLYWNKGDIHAFQRCVLEWTYINNALRCAKDRLD